MPTIPLRQYCRDIEQLINNNQSDEALVCCQRILEVYPLCLDAYRLQGKAHLELQQYDKAEVAFQKVLASVPDDFVANLGMSLLREKQTNLSGAIWHMERANEAQLGNPAVQNERRRLYKLRDGIATSRLPSTSGNLIRMYLNGDMLSNAINEINSVLLEDPSRLDLKVLLARAYMRSGKKEETIQTCRELLKELPLCFEANRILFESRSPAIKIEEMQTLQQRLRDLDPYYEFVTPEQPDIKKVPDERVLLNIPDGSGPKTATTGIPGNLSFSSANSGEGLMGSSGSDFGQRNHSPSWMPGQDSRSLSGLASNTGTIAGVSPATPNSGFNFGKNMTTDEPTSRDRFSSEPDNSQNANQPANPFLSSSNGAIPAAEPGDIPEWLKALAAEPPAASSDAITAPLRVPGETGVLQTGEENLDFLRNFGEEAANEPPAPAQPSVKPAQGPLETLPGTLPASPFLTSSETTQPVPIEDTSAAEKTTGRDMPDWLKSAAEPQSNGQLRSVESDFRDDFNSIEIPSAPQQPVIMDNPFEMPEETVTAPVSDEEIPTPEIEQYLEQLRKDITPQDQPDWLKKENLGNELEALFEEKPAAQPQAPQSSAAVIPNIEPEPEPEQPDWMAQLKEQETSEPAQQAASIPENVPDWLFTPEEETDGSTAPIQSETPVTHQPPPDWLQAARPDIFGREELLEEPPAQNVTPAAPVSPEISEPASDITAAIKDEPVEEQQGFPPELDFMKSQAIDFMNADRSHLTDNLTMPPEHPTAEENIDFTKAAPVENLPADLAALLREETEKQQIHTMPISEESVESMPGFNLELNIPELQKDFLSLGENAEEEKTPAAAEEDTPFSVEAFLQETSQPEPTAEPQIPPTVFDLTAGKQEALPETQQPESMVNIFADEASTSQAESVPQAGIGYETETTMPIEEIEVPQTIESAVFDQQAQPVTPEAVQQFTEAVVPETITPVEETPSIKEPQPEPVSNISGSVDQSEEPQPVKPAGEIEPTIPISSFGEDILRTPIEPEPAKPASIAEPTVPVSSLGEEFLRTPLEPESVKPPVVSEPEVSGSSLGEEFLRTPLEPEAIKPPAVSEPEVSGISLGEEFLRTPLEPEHAQNEITPVVENEYQPVNEVSPAVIEPVVPVTHPTPAAEVPPPAFKEPEPVSAPPSPVPAIKPEPVVEEQAPARKPIVPKTVVPKPVVATKQVAPRPVYRPEKPVVITQPTSQRKNAGAADLTRAREAASRGDLTTALRRYIKLINANRALDQVSADLKELTRKNPKNYLAWQTYGDARLRSNRIQEALDAYAKAADLLK
ncbi:MAG: tetratricopeptide repeat protein [Chloroflexi bacterium]|nr:tetratricopeptide repeat protein [Chloroflexota bacterium]BCY19066.1 hypothetical protein hrd7_29150 [Leptolinea sp. HRD-7]